MTFSAKQMDTENITREISQIQKDKQCILPFTCLWNLKKIIRVTTSIKHMSINTSEHECKQKLIHRYRKQTVG